MNKGLRAEKPLPCPFSGSVKEKGITDTEDGLRTRVYHDLKEKGLRDVGQFLLF